MEEKKEGEEEQEEVVVVVMEVKERKGFTFLFYLSTIEEIISLSL